MKLEIHELDNQTIFFGTYSRRDYRREQAALFLLADNNLGSISAYCFVRTRKHEKILLHKVDKISCSHI